MSTRAPFYNEIEETTGIGMSNWCYRSECSPDGWRLVAFMKAMILVHRVMSTVLYRRIAMAIKTASKVGSFFIVILLIVAQVAAAAILSE